MVRGLYRLHQSRHTLKRLGYRKILTFWHISYFLLNFVSQAENVTITTSGQLRIIFICPWVPDPLVSWFRLRLKRQRISWPWPIRLSWIGPPHFPPRIKSFVKHVLTPQNDFGTPKSTWQMDIKLWDWAKCSNPFHTGEIPTKSSFLRQCESLSVSVELIQSWHFW